MTPTAQTTGFAQFPPQLTALAQALTEVSTGEDGEISYESLPPFYLPAEQGRQLQKLVDDLYGPLKYSTRYAWDELLNMFDQWIIEERNGAAKKTLEERFAALRADFQAPCPKQIVVMPVYGLELKLDKLSIGHVQFVKYGDTAYRKRWADDMAAHPRLELQEVFLPLDDDVTCLHYETHATQERAAQLAQQAALGVLNVLRYTVSRSQFADQHVQFDLFSGENRKRFRRFLVVNEHGTKALEHGHYAGPDESLVLDAAWYASAQAVGLDDISTFLKQDQLTPMQTVLFAAVYWFGNYQAQSSLDNQLLSLATSIEAGLGTRAQDNITVKLAEGLAVLLGQDREERIRIREDFKKLYKLRSGVSHGSQAKVTSADVGRFDGYARRLIHVLIQSTARFKSHEELRQHIDDCKMSF
ncbi:hypothetical protein GO986_22305 [Deinococcus sp. HMF7620]|uniref:Apea-like HEPN domain-containing protein n=1 Tax=Deinococcus arboris TaxID=2682977 RepID=A0A7C9I651_9DEIO|nr:HEPN domain-containing protein [Deinococcus arboris]MVN89471.1 hypothetical protein [Deinococcus arboris]